MLKCMGTYLRTFTFYQATHLFHKASFAAMEKNKVWIQVFSSENNLHINVFTRVNKGCHNFIWINSDSSRKKTYKNLQATSPFNLKTCLQDLKILESSKSTQIARLNCRFSRVFLKVRLISPVHESHMSYWIRKYQS